MKIYLAGKITKNGWREQFVPSLRWAYGDDDYRRQTHWPVIQDAIGPGLHYVGPFFVSDDHGCFHGDTKHGFGATGDACGGAYEPEFLNHGCCYYPGSYPRRQSVVYRCLEAIDNADRILAVIGNDTHGTLIEIGYALGKDKMVNVCSQVGPCDGKWDGEWTPDDIRTTGWFAFALPGTREECCAFHAIERWQRKMEQRSGILKEEALCESPVELAFLREMRKHRALDRFAPNVKVMGGKYRIDFADVDTLIGVEIDGYEFHSDKDSFIKDRQRHRELDELGWRLTRFSGSEVHHDAAGSVTSFKRWLNAVATPSA